jgi:hypothetical protein
LGKVFLAIPPPGKPPGWYVFQRTALGRGQWAFDAKHTLQMRRHTLHNASRSPAQLVIRNRFRTGVWAWQNATSEQRQWWPDTSKDKNLPLYHIWMSWWMLRGVQI